MTTTSLVPPTIHNLPLDLLDASPKNPRRTMDDKGLEELAASIKQSGISQPLLVRPDTWTEGLIEGRFEIVCGHRRSEAATIAGLEEVPCIVRTMTDQEAAEIALVDNLQRVDVPALEEAEAFSELFARLGSIPAVAAKVGKEQAYVAKSLKLLTLTTWSRDALREGLITIDHARLLARLAEAEQNDALKWCLDTQAGKKTPVWEVLKNRLKRKNPIAEKAKAEAALDRDGSDDEDLDDEDFEEDFDDDIAENGRRSVWNHAWECESVQRLKEHIESNSGEPLDRAPWPMEEDWLLPDAGSCLDCPKNTKANTPLFGDLDMGVAVCTDGACFKAKTEGFVLHGIETAKKAADDSKAPILRVSWKATSTVPRMERSDSGANIKPDVPKLGQVFKAGQWLEAKKKCEHARAAVTVDWSDANNRGYGGGSEKLRKPGEIVRVCVDPGCKTHAKAYVKAAKSGGALRERSETEEQRKSREERMQIAARAETEIRVRLASEAISKIGKFPDGLLRMILLEQLPNGDERKALEAVCPGVEKTLKTAKLDSLEFGRAVAAASLTGRYLAVWRHWEAKQFRKEFIQELGRLGYDASKAWEKPKVPIKKPTKPSSKKAAKPAAKKAAKKAGRK